MLLLAEHIEGIPKSKGSLTPIPLPLDCPHCEKRIPPNLIRHSMVEKKSPEARGALTAWREAIGYTLNKYEPVGVVRGKYLRPVGVNMWFTMPRPKSAPSYQERPTTMPDIDKLGRVVLDELTGRVITDDRQVCDVEIHEEYAGGSCTPGLQLEVYQDG
jgi:Holliday junction resolvase RusA-like endonuclease